MHAPPRRRLVALSAATVVVLAVTACGSRVPDDQATTTGAGALSQPVGGTALPGTTAPDGVSPTGAVPVVDPASGGGGAPDGSGDGSGNGSGGADTPGDPSSTTPGAPSDPAEDAPPPVPKDTSPLKVGVMYLDGADQLGNALGVSGLQTGDTQAQSIAIVEAINEAGGVAGRKIDLRIVKISVADALGGTASALQAACAKLTEDEKVDFAISYHTLQAGTIACFAKAGVGVIDDSSTLTDDLMQKYAGLFAAPGDFAVGRMMTSLVDSLWRTGWLTKSSKVGALSYDDAGSKAVVTGALTKALAAHGLKIASAQSISRDAAGATQSGSAVLRFRTAGVDRVIPVQANPLFLMTAASSQGYRPRYALYSSFGPGALLEASAPKDQLAGAAGIGWSPYYDIGRGRKPGPVSGNETRCFSIMAAAGQTSSSATTKAFQTTLCNSFFFLAHAGAKVGGAPADLLARARAAVGTSYSPANTFRSDVRSRPDGVAAYRDLTFVAGCGCFQYGALHDAS